MAEHKGLIWSAKDQVTRIWHCPSLPYDPTGMKFKRKDVTPHYSIVDGAEEASPDERARQPCMRAAPARRDRAHARRRGASAGGNSRE
eukprot:SAG22_NODE_179_length_16124_cov_7.355445_11_plen_88_part_00